MRTYEYHGFTIEVTVEADFTLRPAERAAVHPHYAAVVRVYQAGNAIATFSPLRFDIAGGRPFDTEADALMAGYSAARRIVDDLFARAADAADSALNTLTGSKALR
ncbi:hypothetical protein BJG93_30950 (plasmid) [Paraburkholderia sprentiae WSM5005]|uniref:Uncharacterized protein n=2 Tax=Paraburkholderia sprentiae TaxID=948107 RepID=A0A1I9YVD1_9BURK|nr:hypothetical protein [Paraburkholderia sprentiae]APA90162.1 hypothetical protein BJG93_30950 [Paraburkholderia sprentiae WSM5005]